MVAETTNPQQQHLVPLKHAQEDLFLCDVGDAVLKDIMPQMEHPFYSLSKKPEMTVRRYEHNGNWLEVTPSFKGLATIYDKDILIYCISKLIEKMNRGEAVSPKISITSYDLLAFTNRGTSGRDYLALSEAIDRLAGTRIKTNIRTGAEEQEDNFGLVNAATLRRKHGTDGRLLTVTIELSTWVMNAVKAQEVLTLHRDYFRLRKPIERRIYELARKHCGRQPKWVISVEVLLRKSGSQSTMKHFRQMVKQMATNDHLPDYRVTFDEAADQVIFHNREKWTDRTQPVLELADDIPALPTDVFELAKAAAPGYDVYALEQEWRKWWVKSGRPKLVNPSAAFVGFCASRSKKKPISRRAEK